MSAERDGVAGKNGAGAAALLSAGVGAVVLAVLAMIADHAAAVKNALIFWKPTGALSGETTIAIVVWLGAWAALHALWKRRDVAIGSIAVVALVLLVLSVVLTFPPVGDMFG